MLKLWVPKMSVRCLSADYWFEMGAAYRTGPSHNNLVEEWYAIRRLVGLDLMAKLRRLRGGPFAGGARRRAWLFVGLLIGFGGPARAMDLPEPAGHIRKNFTVEDRRERSRNARRSRSPAYRKPIRIISPPQISRSCGNMKGKMR